jgi:hypothetical protein
VVAVASVVAVLVEGSEVVAAWEEQEWQISVVGLGEAVAQEVVLVLRGGFGFGGGVGGGGGGDVGFSGGGGAGAGGYG